MITNIRKRVPPFVAAALLPAALLAQPVEFDGHHYEVVSHAGISWSDAEYAASIATFDGVNGHLATITSAAEDQFVEDLRQMAEVRMTYPLQKPEVWVGGMQELSTSCPDEPGCGWTWINGEGPISTTQEPLFSYSNWLPQEPNDSGGEEHLGVGLNGSFGWNDEGRLNNIGGYVIEFDTEVPLDDCVGGTGCETTAGQMLTFPETAQAPVGASIGVKRFEFTDDLVDRCAKEELVLFDNDGIADNELIIPPYLCGSPKFLVVALDTTDVEIPLGTIFVENEVTDVLPGNEFECTGPINPVPDPDLDPQHRDVVAWQSTDPNNMLENELGSAAGFPGALAEFTFECGSSRGRVKSASYYVIGMHIDFGPGFDFETNPTGNNYMFNALTRYKLQVLRASVLESRVALNRFAFRVLKSLIRTAIRFHDRDRFRAALFTLKVFEFVVNNVNYRIVPGENFNGEHLARVGNIRFMYTDKLLPFVQ